MGIEIPRSVSDPVKIFLAACSKHVSEVSKKVKNRCQDLADKNRLALGTVRRVETPTYGLLKKVKKLSKVSRVRLLLMRQKKPFVIITGSSSSQDNHALWRRTILLGDKCKPLDFSGVIYYDSEGKKTDRIPTKVIKSSVGPGSSVSPFYLSNDAYNDQN